MKKFKTFFATSILFIFSSRLQASSSLQAAVEIDEALHSDCQKLPVASIPLAELGNYQPGFLERQSTIQKMLPAWPSDINLTPTKQ